MLFCCHRCVYVYVYMCVSVVKYHVLIWDCSIRSWYTLNSYFPFNSGLAKFCHGSWYENNFNVSEFTLKTWTPEWLAGSVQNGEISNLSSYHVYKLFKIIPVCKGLMVNVADFRFSEKSWDTESCKNIINMNHKYHNVN